MKIIPAMIATMFLASPVLAGDDWYPSKYGVDDTKGATNNLSPEGAIKAAKLVKTGKVYALGTVTGPDSPAYEPRSYQVVITQSNDGTGTPGGINQATGNDDILMTYVGIGTQIDGFAHLGINHRYYNGAHGKDIIRPGGVTKYGTETILPTATRGILLDMTKQYKQNPVKPGTAFNRPEIDAAAKAVGVKIGKGDVVLFHTGWLETAKADPKGFIAQQPGLGQQGAEYLASLGVVMVGADTAALEAIPFENPQAPFIVHQTLLAKHGIHVLETINTAELAADGASEFMFVLGVPRFKGTVQMVINPVAIR